MNKKNNNSSDDNTNIIEHTNNDDRVAAVTESSKKISPNSNITSLSSKTSRCLFVTSLLHLTEKGLIAKLNDVDDNNSTQDDMLDFLQNNNSFYHSQNKKILKGKFYKKTESEDFFDKSLNDYIVQFTFFPVVNNYTDNNIDTDVLAKTPKSSKKILTVKIKRERAMILSKIKMSNKFFDKTNKDTVKKNGISCFSCIARKKIKTKTINLISSIGGNNNNFINGNSATEHSVPNINDDNNNKTSDQFAVIEVSSKKKSMTPLNVLNPSLTQINTKVSSTAILGQSKPSFLNLNTQEGTPMFSPKNGITTEVSTFPIKKKINIVYLLTSDIAKAISFIAKTRKEESILHSFSFTLNKTAFFSDLHFYELDLRTNFKSLIKHKSIKFPIILYGNVYFPNLVFFRGDEQVNFKVLDTPIVTPLVIAQVMPLGFVEDDEVTDVINRRIINENVEITEQLNYNIIIVNMLQLTENRQLVSMMKFYVDGVKTRKEKSISTVCFVINTSEDQLRLYLDANEMNGEINNEYFKVEIVSL